MILVLWEASSRIPKAIGKMKPLIAPTTTRTVAGWPTKQNIYVAKAMKSIVIAIL